MYNSEALEGAALRAKYQCALQRMAFALLKNREKNYHNIVWRCYYFVLFGLTLTTINKVPFFMSTIRATKKVQLSKTMVLAATISAITRTANDNLVTRSALWIINVLKTAILR